MGATQLVTAVVGRADPVRGLSMRGRGLWDTVTGGRSVFVRTKPATLAHASV